VCDAAAAAAAAATGTTLRLGKISNSNTKKFPDNVITTYKSFAP
jgi:hypothetical protein